MPQRLLLMLFGMLVSCATTPSPSDALKTPAPVPGRPLALPVKFSEDRFFVQPVTREGQTLTFYTDTGGGLFILADAVTRLGLQRIARAAGSEDSKDWVRMPDFRNEAWMPMPEGTEGQLPVAAMERVLSELGDGLLGQGWFAGRVWTFDYPGGKLWLRAARDVPEVAPAHRVALGFPTDATGKRQANFPRIQVRVDGETLDLLFDTGAMLSLTESARKVLADERPATRATNFITRSTFERWHQRHPDWRVIEDGDTYLPGSTLIEVPRIEVAGHEVGPVWFTTRPDPNFREFMSQFMDKPVEGALGGNALRFFRVTVDYDQAVAVFERAP
ncbi:hypothetical protein HUA76_42180 [Myxococcus sp. CA056]|uniref:hypothetical protein n=1 Tax=unclassified Myxococcus TaxID=2648731 RepID=UPI00157AF56D|nr:MULTISPECIES: hypothetical protein [unclassified Myxococcus]NTX17399.1 hypothetical protein [Myxococcus sp. CA056]NTX52074.1 hypothetical protein [Myxococcus sp. CA039A]